MKCNLIRYTEVQTPQRYYRSIDAHQNHRVENIRSERPRVPCPDIRSNDNSSRICSITFPTQSRYAFAELTRWMRPGERGRARGTASTARERQGYSIKSEKDVFRSEIVCWLSTSSLTSQRGRRAAKRQRGRARWAMSHGPQHLRAKLLLTALTSREHISLKLSSKEYRSQGIFSSAPT